MNVQINKGERNDTYKKMDNNHKAKNLQDFVDAEYIPLHGKWFPIPWI